MYFQKDGGYSLREFKKFYKIEMEEHPERYTLAPPSDNEDEKVTHRAAVKAAYKTALGDGPIIDMAADRTEEIKQLREELDSYIPKIRERIDKAGKDYRKDPEYRRLSESLKVMELSLKEALLDGNPIDEEVRAEAAALVKGQTEEVLPLLPIHLRFMARQLKQILVMRKHNELEVANDELYMFKDTEQVIDVGEVIFD